MIQSFLTILLIGEKAVNGQMGHKCQQMKECYLSLSHKCDSSTVAAAV